MGTVSRMPPPHNYTVAFVEERAFSHLLSGVHTISFSLHSAVSPLLFEFLSRNLEPNNDNKTHVNGYSVSENVIGHLHDDVRWHWVTTTTRMLCQYPLSISAGILGLLAEDTGPTGRAFWYLWSPNVIV